MQIIADHQITCVVDYFSSLGDVRLVDSREINSELIAEADILLVRSVTPVDSRLLEKSKIKYVASATSGIDHVDTQYLENNRIGFAHAPGSNARSVAEYVLSCLFIWADQSETSLLKKKIGIIGHGYIGKCLHELLKVMGIHCLINDPPLKAETHDEKYCDLDKVLSADIITLHVPYDDEGEYPTNHLVNSEFLEKLNKTALLINTSRGEVVDEAALLDYMAENDEITVILDVWKNEPLINTKLLEKVYVGTPHIAGYSLDGKINATRMLYLQACEYFSRDKINADVQTCPAPGHQNLSAGCSLDEIELIKFAVLGHYDVRRDSLALKTMLDVEKSRRGDFFDRLRRNYPVRREFPASRIHLNPNQIKSAEKLRGLGFMVEVT